MKRAFLAGLLLHCAASPAFAQAPGKLGLSVAVGAAVNSGTPRYDSGFPMTARLAASLGLTRWIGLEGGLAVTGGLVPSGDDAVLIPPPAGPKTGYKHFGGSLSLVVAPSGNLAQSSFRLMTGAGLYRVSDVDGARSSLTRGALHLGVEQLLSSPARRLKLFIGARAVWFQDLGGSGALHLPFEFGVRFR